MPLLRAHVVPHPPLIVPAVGQGRENDIAATVNAYKQVADSVAADKPDLILYVTPHGVVYEDYIHIAPERSASGDFARFGAPDERYSLVYDEAFIRRLVLIAEAEGISAGTMGGRSARALDHGVTVPMHFINARYTDYNAVRVSISGLPVETHYRFGQCIQTALRQTGRRAVLIASGDLSHKLTQDGPYGYAAEGPDFDRQLCEALRDGDFLRLLSFDRAFCERAAECGLRSFIIMAGTLDGCEVSVQFRSYEGPFGVGYALASFTPSHSGSIDASGDGEAAKNAERCFLTAYTRIKKQQIAERRANEDAYVRLARRTVETYVMTGKIIQYTEAIDGADGEVLRTQRSGTFVSIKKNGELRGCIGTTSPYRMNIAEEIIGNAISASTQDPRFDAITADELPALTYSVDVLSPAEPIDGPEQLDVQRYGVIVTNGRKRGLLLPNLEGVDTIAQQLDIARRKAGIAAHEPCALERFEVVRHY